MYEPYGNDYTIELPSRPVSLDLTTTHSTYDTYDMWTELQHLP
jgi:hypothetical protein